MLGDMLAKGCAEQEFHKDLNMASPDDPDGSDYFGSTAFVFCEFRFPRMPRSM